MDATNLLLGFRPATSPDFRRKALSLRSAHHILEAIEEPRSLSDLASFAGEALTCRFGGAAQDSYFTTFLSVVRAFDPTFDVLLAATLNSIVLQMNFQTRLSIDGVMGPAEAVLYEGAAELYPILMTHGNTTLGVHISTKSGEGWLPAWANAHPALEVNQEHALRMTPENYALHLDACGRSRIGAIMLALPGLDWGDISFGHRYAAIAHKFSRHTICCIAGTAEMTLAVARQLNERYPDVRFSLRLYARKIGNASEYRGIIVASGFAELPDIVIEPGARRMCSFVEAAPKDAELLPSVELVDYFSGRFDRIEYRQDEAGVTQAIGRWEPAEIRRPWLLSSSAPLPEEARGRISDDTEIFHSLARLKGGFLIPSDGPGHSIYVHATGEGEVITDYGDEMRRILETPIFQNVKLGEDGINRAQLKADRILRVRGGAMPLTFTPTLHKWHSHFMIQCLPRVRIARDLQDDIKFLVPEDLRSKQLEMLAALGYPEDRIVRMPAGAIIQAEELIVPRAWRLAFTSYTADIYRELGEQYLGKGRSGPRRLLISRESRKSWRNMLNYESVKSLLIDDYGFEVAAPERLSLADEISLYAGADIVVGAEGAGMYGAAFSRPGSVYLTLCDEDYVMPILGTLAHVRDIDVGYVFGESMRADADLPRRLPFGHADFVLDVERVEQAVKAAIARVEAKRH